MFDFDTNAIIERIKFLRQEHSGKRGKSSFAKSLGISPSTYNYYESNRVPPLEILLRITEVTKTDIEWLLTGHKSEQNFAFRQNSGFFDKLSYLFANNHEAIEAVTAFVEILLEKKGLESIHRPNIGRERTEQKSWIPILGQTAAGVVHFWDETIRSEPEQAITKLSELVQKHIGKTIFSTTDVTVSVDLQRRSLLQGLKGHQISLVKVSGHEDEGIVEFVQCQELHDLFPDSFALRVDGDSMSPRINDGDIAIVSPSVPAGQGQISIACIANQIGVTCKLIRTTDDRVHLIPINERYETKIIPIKDLQWALAVLCHVSI